MLWSSSRANQERLAAEIDYGGDPNIALNEGFLREASIALELIIKAVIAARIERGTAKPGVVKVRLNHDLVSLWEDAELPVLQRGDLHRLMIAKRILYWAGRYAAPKKDADYAREEADMQPLLDTKQLGALLLYQPRSLSWDDFNRIYEVASASLGEALDRSYEV